MKVPTKNSLYNVLMQMKVDSVPGHDFEYVISFNEVQRKIAFGKTWKKSVPYYWIHEDYAPVLAYQEAEEDKFLADLFSEPYLQRMRTIKPIVEGGLVNVHQARPKGVSKREP